MAEFETIIYEKHDGVGYVTLNRPQVLNTYNLRMRDELYQVLGAIRDDPEVRVVILRVPGKGHSALAPICLNSLPRRLR